MYELFIAAGILVICVLAFAGITWMKVALGISAVFYFLLNAAFLIFVAGILIVANGDEKDGD